MRFRKGDIHQRICSDLNIEFGEQEITCYAGLELFKQYFRSIDLSSRIRRAFNNTPLCGDFKITDHIMTLMALWLTGGRRLRHIPFMAEDPLVKRLCGLKHLPSDRSVSNFLKQFTLKSVAPLVDLNHQFVLEKLKDLKLSRVTLDFDGTILSCGDQVGWAQRGYNPHKRHSKSYYPLLCHISQTGHFLQVKNRPGNVHDSKGGALMMIKQCIQTVREALPAAKIEVRLDAAFFTEEIVDYLESDRIEFAMKVPMWSALGFKELIAVRKTWNGANDRLKWFRASIRINKWDREVDVIVYRRKLSDKPPKKPFQLDLFSPNDGKYEYQVIFSNKTIQPENVLEFFNGRSAIERQIAEIKGEFAFDVVPTRHYQANTAHQQISLLAYNLVRNFQLDSEIAKPRKKSMKRTFDMTIQSLKTVRFEMIVAPGRLLNLENGKTLRISKNKARENRFRNVMNALEQVKMAA